MSSVLAKERENRIRTSHYYRTLIMTDFSTIKVSPKVYSSKQRKNFSREDLSERYVRWFTTSFSEFPSRSPLQKFTVRSFQPSLRYGLLHTLFHLIWLLYFYVIAFWRTIIIKKLKSIR